ncbi:hypothetical protein [Raoultella sp. HC6]|uniref:hypothetical protein n=1 Tax=Raoultella sp. HC6 TaxID=2923366 RepID=UPI001F5116C1|nr:hypothetical protein [Raoultella sp. HC6]
MIPAAYAVDGAYFGIHIMELFISFYYKFEIYFSFVRGRSKNGDIREEMKGRGGEEREGYLPGDTGRHLRRA